MYYVLNSYHRGTWLNKIRGSILNLFVCDLLTKAVTLLQNKGKNIKVISKALNLAKIRQSIFLEEADIKLLLELVKTQNSLPSDISMEIIVYILDN